MADGPIEARASPGPAPLVHVHLKVVPRASQAEVVGRHADRLKVRVSAPAESGKANRAVLALLAATLEVPASTLTIVRGHGLPRKTVAVTGLDAACVARRLGMEAP